MTVTNLEIHTSGISNYCLCGSIELLYKLLAFLVEEGEFETLAVPKFLNRSLRNMNLKMHLGYHPACQIWVSAKGGVWSCIMSNVPICQLFCLQATLSLYSLHWVPLIPLDWLWHISVNSACFETRKYTLGSVMKSYVLGSKCINVCFWQVVILGQICKMCIYTWIVHNLTSSFWWMVHRY